MIYKYIIGVVAGGAVGGIVGYFRKCASGTCPLTSNPIGGMIFGMLVGVVVASALSAEQEVFSPSPHPIEIKTPSDFDRVPGEDDLVLVNFYSNGCGACRRLKPVIHGIATQYSGRIAVVAVNADELGTVARKYSVGPIHDARIFRGRKLLTTILGLNPKSTYTELPDGMLTKQRSFRTLAE